MDEKTKTATPATSLHEASRGTIGTWRIVKDGQNRRFEMYPDANMLKLLGLDSFPGPAACFSHWAGRIEPEDLPKTEKMAQQMESTFDFNEVEYRWHHPAWGLIYVRCGGRMERMEDGVSYQTGYHQNITGIVKLLEKNQRQSEELAEISRQKKQYNDLFQSVICGIAQYRLAPDGAMRFVKANHEAMRIFGYTPDEFWAKEDWNLNDLTSPEDRAALLQHAAALQGSGDKSSFEYRILQKNGASCWVVGTAEFVPDETGENLIQSVFLDIDDRKRAERENQRLRQEKEGISEILRMALSGTRIHQFSYYPQERRALLSERLCQAYGFKRRYDRLPHSFADECVYAPDRPAYCRIYEQIDAGAPYASAEFRLEGGTTWLRLGMSVVQYSPDKTAEYAVGIVEDISAQKRAESEKDLLAQRNNEVLHSLNELFFGVYRLNLTSGKIRAIRVSKDLQNVVDAQRERKYRAEDLATLYHADDRLQYASDMSLANLRRLYERGQKTLSREYRRCSPHGYFWVACTVYFKETAQDVIAILAVTDITERHKMTDVIQALSDEYHAVYYLNLLDRTYETLRRDTRAGGVKAPSQGNLAALLPCFEAQTLPEEREAMRAFYAQIAPAVFASQKKHSRIFRERRGDGFEWAQAILIGGQTEESAYATLAFRSVDQDVRQEIETKKLLQSALDRAESANRAKSSFLSRMSHDIRTPMNAILGLSYLARTQKSQPEKLDDYFAKIALAGNHLMELINEVLDMSKIESGNLTLDIAPFDLRALLLATVAMHQSAIAEKRQQLDLQLGGLQHAQVLGDALRIQLILNNILSNACKHTPPEGAIRLSVQETRASKDLSNYAIRIQDTGIGMQKEFQKHIFEPFAREDDSRTSRVHGTGLGMTIAYSLAQMMDGDIQLDSEPGKGSRFTILLPLKHWQEAPPAAAEAKASSDDLAALDLSGKRLLIVEDNALNLEIACALLAATGAQIETARDGKEAVDTLLAASPGRYDLVLMDVQMPVMNGLEAAAAIRAAQRADLAALPIIAVTANAFVEDIQAALAAGMNAHIAKPLDFNELCRLLRRWLQ